MVCRISAEIHSLHNWLFNSMAQGRPLVADSCQLANRSLAFTECESSSSCSQKHTIWLDCESVKSSPHVHIPPFLKAHCNIVFPLCIATSQPPPDLVSNHEISWKKSLWNFSFPHMLYVELSYYQNTVKQTNSVAFYFSPVH